MLRSFTRRSLAAVLIAAVLVALPFSASGQEGEGNRQPVRVTAKVKGMQGPILMLAGGENQQWLVKMPEGDAAIRTIGTALPGWLQRGMFVRFSAKFDTKKGVVVEPVGSLTVFTPRLATRPDEPSDPLGVFPEAGLVGAELFREPAGEAKPAGKPAQSETQIFQVAGQLNGIRDGKMFVSAGNAIVRAELAADAAIGVDVVGLRWFQMDDSVEVDGWAYPQRKSEVYANRLTVRPAKPLGTVDETEAEKPKGTPGKPTAGKPSATKKDEKKEDSKLPF